MRILPAAFAILVWSTAEAPAAPQSAVPPAPPKPARATAPVAAAKAAPRVVDLGHPLAADDPSWSGQKVYEWSPVARMDKDGYFAGRFATEEHFGTHVDAPAHFAEKGWTVDRIPADRLVRPAVTLHLEGKAAAAEDYRLTVADLDAFEGQHGRIPEGTIVLVATGWDARWKLPGRYMNEKNGVKHFPGLSVEAAQRLVDRKVAAVGIDTASIDYGPSTAFEAHHTTMPHDIYHVENAANLGSLPARGFTVVVAPVALTGGSGGPTRIFALLP
jgi:kynurenine formamidase